MNKRVMLCKSHMLFLAISFLLFRLFFLFIFLSLIFFQGPFTSYLHQVIDLFTGFSWVFHNQFCWVFPKSIFPDFIKQLHNFKKQTKLRHLKIFRNNLNLTCHQLYIKVLLFVYSVFTISKVCLIRFLEICFDTCFILKFSFSYLYW